MSRPEWTRPRGPRGVVAGALVAGTLAIAGAALFTNPGTAQAGDPPPLPMPEPIIYNVPPPVAPPPPPPPVIYLPQPPVVIVQPAPPPPPPPPAPAVVVVQPAPPPPPPPAPVVAGVAALPRTGEGGASGTNLAYLLAGLGTIAVSVGGIAYAWQSSKPE